MSIFGAVVEAVSAATRTSSGASSPVRGYADRHALRAQLDVTAASGTGPTLDVAIEDTLDDVNWNVVGTFAQKGAIGREVINVTTPFADKLRVRWTVGGMSPSFTFGVRWVAE